MRYGLDRMLPSWIRSGRIAIRPEDMSLDEAARRTIRDLRERYRAVTPEDYEHLALNDWPRFEAARDLGSAGRIRRVRCVPRRNLEAGDPAERAAPAPAHVSLIIAVGLAPRIMRTCGESPPFVAAE